MRRLTAREQAIVLDEVERALAHEPAVETRHRKPMRPNPVAPWELRIGHLRIYYDVGEGSDPVVLVRPSGSRTEAASSSVGRRWVYEEHRAAAGYATAS